jgi:cation diffusion facilitator CzcD-associated flavoprotein CzcO
VAIDSFSADSQLGRSYTEFWTQWTVGLAEYSDMPMERPPEKDCRSDCFKAKYTTQYLEKYVDKMQHRGRSLRERIQFGIQVRSIEKVNEKWELSCTDASNSTLVFSTTKLMIANGENSLPNMPDLPGKETFEGTIIHSENFGQSSIISSETAKHVAVIGAGKSSADMVYEAVKAGKTVSWIIRKSGTGPGFFAPIDLKTPYKNSLEAAQTRIMSSLQPSLLNPTTLWSWFLHSTVLGVAIIKWMFSKLDAAVRNRADYKGRKSTKGFEKLEYDTE